MAPGVLRFVRRSAALALALLLAACASPPTGTAMQVASPTVVRAALPGTVDVSVSGGSETSAFDSPNISSADFKSAVEASLAKARAFESLVDAGGRYALNANIVRLDKPLLGLTFTVELEVAWSLIDRRDGKVLLRKALSTSGTATLGDAFAGVTRLRMAVEAAARANIEQFLRELPVAGG